jgi:hypothetical protein
MVLDTEAGGSEASPVYKAVTCDSNNVGVPAATYGLPSEQRPCVACLQGMVTTDSYKSSETGGQGLLHRCQHPEAHTLAMHVNLLAGSSLKWTCCQAYHLIDLAVRVHHVSGPAGRFICEVDLLAGSKMNLPAGPLTWWTLTARSIKW